MESRCIIGDTFSGIAKDFVDDFTFIAIAPNENGEGYFYTLKDVLTESNEKTY